MGLLKAAGGAISTTLADQWKEFFYCDALTADVLVAKGEKKIGSKTSNTKGTDNIISNGSVIAVNDGQCMLIVEQGKVVELCAEPGQFVYDTSTEPSVFTGKLGTALKESFQTLWKRFTFGGDAAKDQRVYYFNIKEIIGNKYGTANAVPFRVVDSNIGLDVDIAITCFGEYSYKITNPILFYTNVCGNVTASYARGEIDSQLRSELLTALQPAFAKISAMGIRYSALPGHTSELATALNDELSDKWRELRGVEVISFGVNSVKASEEDEKMIKDLQRSAVYRNPSMAAATLVGAQAEAMKAAAANEGSGAFMAFAGLNMAQNAGGGNANVQQLYQMNQQQAASAAGGWTCACGTKNTGKFCENCGKTKPAATGWTCACGAVSKGKFCQECGKPKPADAPLYRCDKCGWEPEDPSNPPKFCPQCGDRFDANDRI